MTVKTSAVRDWSFQVFFNFTDDVGKDYSGVKRNDMLIFLKNAFERSARFSVIAKSGKEGSYLLLSGFVSQRNPCTLHHMKRILGRCSTCKPNGLGDVINLVRYFNIDKDVTVTGTIASRSTDAKWLMKVIGDDNTRWQKFTRSKSDSPTTEIPNTDTFIGTPQSPQSDTPVEELTVN